MDKGSLEVNGRSFTWNGYEWVRDFRKVNQEDVAAAKSFGFQAHLGNAEDHGPELAGRWWWTVTRPGWSGIEASPDDFATEAEAWADAVRHHYEFMAEEA